jgi:hypothetical protein
LENPLKEFKTLLTIKYRYREKLRQFLEYGGQTAKSLNVPSIEHLPAISYTVIYVPVPNFQDPTYSTEHNIRATGKKPWRNGPPRSDTVWIRYKAEDKYGAMKGRKIGRVECIMQILNLQRRQVAQVALCAIYPHLYGGKLDGPEKLPKLRKDAQPTVVEVKNILGRSHIIDFGEKWAVNTRIDLNTFNTIPVA